MEAKVAQNLKESIEAPEELSVSEGLKLGKVYFWAQITFTKR